MLSYRHGYHAGNYADVLKHAVLLQTLNLLQKKEKGLVYIDTHAGAGGYSLVDDFAQKTGEYQQGVARLWTEPTLPTMLQQYLDNVRHFNAGADELSQYPGSPALVDMNLRPQDRMVLHELHSSDIDLLEEYFGGDQQVKCINGDGLQGLLAAVPPRERRGLILIDPSYEIKTDYQQVADTLIKAYRKFATGVYLLWYPVVQRAQTEAMLQRLKDSGIRRQLRIEQQVRPDAEGFGMTAAGMWIINPPWQLDTLAEEMLPCLQQRLNQQDGSVTVQWEVGE